MTGRNIHHLVPWNDSFCLISQHEPNGLVENLSVILHAGKVRTLKLEVSLLLGSFRLDLDSEFGKGL